MLAKAKANVNVKSLYEDEAVCPWACPGSIISRFCSGILNPDFISSDVIECRVVPLSDYLSVAAHS